MTENISDQRVLPRRQHDRAERKMHSVLIWIAISVCRRQPFREMDVDVKNYAKNWFRATLYEMDVGRH